MVTENDGKTVEHCGALCYNIAKSNGKNGKSRPGCVKKDAESSKAKGNVKRENFIC